MLNKSFLKQISFCALGAGSVSLVQNSVGFTANNQSLITENKEQQSMIAGKKDSVDDNLRLEVKQEENAETELQKEKIFKAPEEYFIDRINGEEFKGFLGKAYLVLELVHIIPTYLNLKFLELLKVDEWPEVPAFIGFIVIRCIFYPVFYTIVFFTYVFALLGLFVGLKYLGQKSKEAISKFINAINISKNKVEDIV